MKNNIKIDILPNQFLNDDGTFDKKGALDLCGKIAGVCYDKEGFSHLKNEEFEKTNKRINMTLNNGHHSVYDHIFVNLNIRNIPKILAMVLNNEKEYTTSEKSARYTKIVKGENSYITDLEEKLYNKWVTLFEYEIKLKTGDLYNHSQIKKLAQENARYLVTVFMPTEMIYTTSLRQINYIVSWMIKYINNINFNSSEFERKLADSMRMFIKEIEELNLLEERLMVDNKFRKLSLFGQRITNKTEYFGDVYNVNYIASFAYLAQAQRHRTLDYEMQIMKNKSFFIPPIISNVTFLIDEWLSDMDKVKDNNPQGELVLINEKGKYEDFILKCKERLCTHAQLEIMLKTKEILSRYKTQLENDDNYLKEDIKKYVNGARCTFPDFKCTSDCKNNDGKLLIRKI